MTEDCKIIVEFLDCEYEVFQNEKDETGLIKRFDEWFKAGKTEGFYPVIILPGSVLTEVLEDITEDWDIKNNRTKIEEYRKNIIEKSELIDAKKFLDERFTEYSELYEDENIKDELVEAELSDSFCSHMDDFLPHEEILMVKIPVKNPWEIAAWIPAGGFNDTPAPEEQAAVFKYWYEKYKAVPFLAAYDIWELKVECPPETDEKAEILAKEQFAFCYDIAMQSSYGSNIRTLAGILKNSHTWYFGWD